MGACESEDAADGDSQIPAWSGEMASVRRQDFGHYFPNSSDARLADESAENQQMDSKRAVLVGCYAVLFAIGVCGNLWVARVVGGVMRRPRTEAPKSVQIFILSLCVCELVVSAFLPLLLSDLIYGRWTLPSPLLCRLYLISESLNKFCEPWLLTALSGFCYVRLRRSPKAAHSANCTRVTLLLVLAVVALTITLTTPIYEHGDLYYLVLYNETGVLSLIVKCAFHPPERVMTVFTVYSFVVGYAAPTALFTFFYVSVLHQAHRQRRRSVSYLQHFNSSSSSGVGVGEDDSGNVARHSQRSKAPNSNAKTSYQHTQSPYLRRVTSTAVGLVTFYLICQSPYWLNLLAEYVQQPDGCDHSDGSVMLKYFIHMLPYINSAFYPVVYTLLNSHIKRDYRRSKMQKRGQNSDQRRSATTSFICSQNAGQQQNVDHHQKDRSIPTTSSAGLLSEISVLDNRF